MKRPSVFRAAMLSASMAVIASCAQQSGPVSTSTGGVAGAVANADEFLVVDCLLPSQVRKLGRQASYLAPRRAIKTAQGDCEIRGGEYVSYDRADLGTALKIWLADAQTGDAQAQVYVGEIFERGVGGQADYAAAAQWYQRAADQGFTPAMINLGQLYEQGRGVEKDEIKALNYYRQASGLGLAFVTTEDTAAEISSLQSQLSARERELVSLKDEVGTLESELAQESQRRAQIARSASQRETELAAARQEVDRERAKLAEQRAVLPPDASELVAERQRLEDKARALADVDASLKKWSSDLENQEAQLSQTSAEIGNASELAAELATARLELQRAQASLATAQATRDEANSTEAARLAQLEKTLAAWGEELDRRESNIDQMEQGIELQQASFGEVQAEASDWLSSVKLSIEESQSILLSEQQDVAVRNDEIAQKEAELSQLDQELQARLAQIKEQENELQSRYEDLEVQQASYADRQDELARLDAQIAQLDNQAKRKLEALAVFIDADELNEISDEDAALGPEITMIDPPVVTRSGERVRSVRVRSNITERAVIGNVVSDEPVLSVVVNDSEVMLNERGVFRTAVPIDRDEVPVSIVAIDQAGRKSALDFTVERDAEIIVTNTPGTDNSILPVITRPVADLGTYHALVIGNNAYTKLPRLETAGQDAQDVAAVLQSRYGMKTKLLLDATRYDILSALNEYRSTLTENDNLVVYYAGHGELDQVNQRGHWLPVDAEPESTANWISNVQITDVLNAMSAKRVLIVADSCYSGALTRSSLARLEAGMSQEARQSWITALATKKARMALTSGGLAPVLDAGGGQNSIFAKAFLDVLNSNNDVLEGQRLHQQVAARVTYAADAFKFEQVPLYAPIKFAGHESGEFFFVPKS